MILKDRFSRFVRQVTLLAGLLLVCILTVVLVEEIVGGRKDTRAQVSADTATSAYQRQFVLGQPLAEVEAALKASNAATVHRGDDVLIVVREGRQIWYCSHNYFGTALRFKEAKLQKIATEEWLETCL